MHQNDTICAIVTGIGAAGVSIIKISGDEAITLADKIWHSQVPISQMQSHTLSYGKLIDNFTEQLVDEGIALLMKGPRSYTGEDIVELQIHGSYVGVTYALELLIKNGARHAEAGEFTRRAFINGKLDLTKAEGIIDLLEAKNRQNLKFATDSVAGKSAEHIHQLIDDITEIIAYLEASIDFPEDDVPSLKKEEKQEKLYNIISDIEEIVQKSNKGKYISEGINLLILGEPNVGKSSFLNLLLDEERAIVSEIPGTTRDTIEEYLTIGKIPAKIIDTAGIRDSDDLIEKIGIDKAKQYIEKSDFIVYILDATSDYDKEKDQIYHLVKEKEKIILLNKTDLVDDQKILSKYKDVFIGEKILPFSTQDHKYLIEFENVIEDIFIDSSYDYNEGTFITNARQKGLLEQSLVYIKQAASSVETDMEDDFLTIDLYDAKKSLEEVLGIQVSEDILDQIFSKFCIGK